MWSVKNKIRLGTIFLFLLVVISGAFSIYYLVKLKEQSRNVLKANYETIQYSHQMQKALDSILDNKTSFIDSFGTELKKQEKNITEAGETTATQNLRKCYNRLRAGDTTKSNIECVRFNLQQILLLNMAAIKNKNEVAEKSAEDAMALLIAIVAVIFLVGLTFSYNFPSIITAPIQKLTQAIKEIGAKNYSHRIHIDSKDEFGQLADAFNEMAGRLEYFESSNLNKIIFEKARAEAVINSMKDASIGIDKNNHVLFANEQASQLLGLKAEETVGKSTEELIRKNDLFKFLLENEGKSPFKIVVDGKENYYVKETVDVSQGEASNKVIVLKNITSFKELDVAKTDFIATVSHELKTPLASSDFSLKLLEDDRVGQEERNELIQQLKNDNQRMLRILSELLNMSQVEAGKIQLDIQSVNPYRTIENSIKAVLTTAKEKDVNIQEECEPDLPNIKADADKISWVLNNFLTNAIRYAPSKTDIIISCKQINGQLFFSVTDKGQGIEEVYLGRIFERYFQVPGRSDRKGSGIGLAICKEFVEAMGGHIWVKSKIGEGSTFGVDIPIG
ncbi:MAG TPA: ATP-binding protein [Flavisolibacter sp.]|nr:ATP-binding protein [Flavisolibacter sp.]